MYLLDFAIRTRGKYPSVSSDHRDLIDHSKDRSDAYFKEATSGSTFIPLLAAWLCGLEDRDALAKLAKLVNEKLDHCTLQLWLLDDSTEESIYRGGHDHGTALSNLSISTCDGLLGTISDACQKQTAFERLSASKTGYWPIVLLACRHYRLPVPPQFWIDLFVGRINKKTHYRYNFVSADEAVASLRLGRQKLGGASRRDGRRSEMERRRRRRGRSAGLLGSSCPALCRASTTFSRAPKARRGWPGRARP